MEKKDDNVIKSNAKMKNRFEKFQKSALLGISFMVILILLVAVTVTWYVFDIKTGTDGLSLNVSDWDFIVSKTQGGPAIGDGETVDISVDAFSNINDGIMAPGTTGTITFYVRTSTDIIKNCYVRLDKSTLKLKVDETNDYSNLLQKHFYFYSDAEMTTEISMDSPMVIDMEKNKEKAVKIYWKWPYDGSEIIPDEIINEEERTAYFKQYDEEDCIISKYSDYVTGKISIQVSGSSENPKVDSENTTGAGE